MIFLSTMKEQSYTISPARYEKVSTPSGDIVIPHKSQRVRFSPLGAPMYTPLLVAKGGKAWGRLDSATQAEKLGVPESVVIDFLMSHPDYGVRIIGIGVDGQEVISEEAYVVNEGEKGYYCKLCEKHLDNVQGMKNHVKSQAHLENFAIAKNEAMVAVQNAR